MKLLDKLKNTFFEEEYVEVEEPEKVEKKDKKTSLKDLKKSKKVKEDIDLFEDEIEEKPIKEEVEKEVASLIEEEPEDDEEEVVEKEEVREEFYSDRDLVNKNKKIDEFDDSDFEPTVQMPTVVATAKKEEKKVYGESVSNFQSYINMDDIDKYRSTSHRAYGATENPFQPTPIISPIYGILDKNYRKEEVIDRKDKPITFDEEFDSVRRKAYGKKDEEETMEKILEKDLETITEPVVEEEIAVEINETPYDPELEAKPILEDVTVGEAEEYFDDLGLEYNVDYKDAQYEGTVGRRSDKYDEETTEEKEDIPTTEIEAEIVDEPEDEIDPDLTLEDLINRNKEKEEAKNEEEKEIDLDETANLEDNLFDLVDSMYEDGE